MLYKQICKIIYPIWKYSHKGFPHPTPPYPMPRPPADGPGMEGGPPAEGPSGRRIGGEEGGPGGEWIHWGGR